MPEHALARAFCCFGCLNTIPRVKRGKKQRRQEERRIHSFPRACEPKASHNALDKIAIEISPPPRAPPSPSLPSPAPIRHPSIPFVMEAHFAHALAFEALARHLIPCASCAIRSMLLRSPLWASTRRWFVGAIHSQSIIDYQRVSDSRGGDPWPPQNEERKKKRFPRPRRTRAALLFTHHRVGRRPCHAHHPYWPPRLRIARYP
jgi:hypothetical protein